MLFLITYIVTYKQKYFYYLLIYLLIIAIPDSALLVYNKINVSYKQMYKNICF